ncbi:unnamed protein product [Sphenostylis stenocarpa]|uniref:Uncharacterized protein n=1 Tax=Sphenostylis stenocarpa TaxID=92480 RepID=A0AA86W2U3_9FABA|nr:unnamed protein product [Sphenostylis stenocarpa]
MKMGQKHVALLLMWLAVGVCDDEEMTLEEKREDCNSYCYRACMFPAAFCKWWCGGRCRNPIFWDERLDDDDASKMYLVPTEENYKAYSSANPPSSSSNIEISVAVSLSLVGGNSSRCWWPWSRAPWWPIRVTGCTFLHATDTLIIWKCCTCRKTVRVDFTYAPITRNTRFGALFQIRTTTSYYA